MADDSSADASLTALIRHLTNLPDALRPGRSGGGVYDIRSQVLEPSSPWIDALFEHIEACKPLVRTPESGQGLDSAWLRGFCEFLRGFEEVESEKGRSEALFRYDFDFASEAISNAEVAYGIKKFRHELAPSRMAGVLAEDESDLFDQLRALARHNETHWAAGKAPPPLTDGDSPASRAIKVSEHELRRSLDDFRRDAGTLILRLVDECRIPDTLRKEKGFTDAVCQVFRGGIRGPGGLLNYLCDEWLPEKPDDDTPATERAAASDDAARFGEGVRVARRARQLVDALYPRSPHTEELMRMADEAASKRSERDRREARFFERKTEYFDPYDTVWLDLESAPCNPSAGKPLDPEWLLERLTTLVARARTLDEFDGGTGEIDRLRWLRDSPPAANNEIAKAFAVAMAAAVDGEFDRSAAAALCGMLESHPGNELRALYRAYPEGDTRPRWEPKGRASTRKPIDQASTVAWLIARLTDAEGFAALAEQAGERANEPSSVEGWYVHHRKVQNQHAADRDAAYASINATEGSEELRAWLNYHDIPWTKAAVEKQRDRLFVEKGLSRGDVDALTLNDFLSWLWESSADAGATAPESPSPSGDGSGLIDRLLAGPDDVELSHRELALLRAHLKQGVSFSAIQQERQKTGESATTARRNKLKLILDFNLGLQTPSGEPGSHQDEHLRVDQPHDVAPPNGVPDDGLTPAQRKAWATYKLAEESGLVGKTDREVYDWLAEQDDEFFVGDLVGYELRSFATWERYVRAGRQAAGEQKNTRRAGRGTGKSIVKPDDL